MKPIMTLAMISPKRAPSDKDIPLFSTAVVMMMGPHLISRAFMKSVFNCFKYYWSHVAVTVSEKACGVHCCTSRWQSILMYRYVFALVAEFLDVAVDLLINCRKSSLPVGTRTVVDSDAILVAPILPLFLLRTDEYRD